MEEVIIIAILLWLRGGKTDSSPSGSGGGSGGAGGASGSGGSGGTIVTTTMTPSLTDKPTPTSGIGYRPVPSPTTPSPQTYQPPTPQVPQIVTPVTPPSPPVPPTPPPQVRDPGTPPGPTLVPPWDDGRPAFCGKEWIPLELTACAPGRDNPLPRTGTPPPGTRVMAYAPPWSSAYYSSPSCPAQPVQGGIHYIIAGSPEWLQVCGPANPTQEI